MRCPSAIAMACLALAAAGPVSSPAEAKTFVLPHVLETSGEAGVTEYTFDTRLSLSPVPSSGATGPARVDLYLYDTLGLPLPAGPGVGRCDPCTLWVDTGVPETVMTVESLLRAGGNFPTMPGPWLGVVVADDALDVQAFTVNRHGGPQDLSVFGFAPQEVEAAVSAGPSRRLADLREDRGTVQNTDGAYDTTIWIAKPLQMLGGPSPSFEAVIRLFDADGAPLQVGGVSVAPIVVTSAAPPAAAFGAVRVELESLFALLPAGAPAPSLRGLSAEITLSGPGAGEVDISAFVRRRIDRPDALDPEGFYVQALAVPEPASALLLASGLLVLLARAARPGRGRPA